MVAKSRVSGWMLAAAVAALVSWMLVIPGCRTMEGAGKDIQKAGEKIEDKADENK